MRSLRKKDKRLKRMIRENIVITAQFNDLLWKYRSVNERLESICCKYMDLYRRKEDEVLAKFVYVSN